MIEQDHAGRLGATIVHASSISADIDTIIDQITHLGLRHIRLVLNRGEENSSLDTILARLIDVAEVLPCFGDIDPHVIGRLLDRHGGHVDAVELTVQPWDLANLVSCAGVVRDAGKKVVVGLGAGSPAMLARLGEAGVLRMSHAVGITAASDTVPDGTRQDLLAASRAHAPHVRLWLTQAGNAAKPHQLAAQLTALLDALATDAERIYWAALSDTDHAHGAGFYDAHGGKNLLARLLAGGVHELQRTLALTRRLPKSVATRPVLVTGGAGFIGVNLADRLAAQGHDVRLYDALARPGVERNLRWLAKRHPTRISFQLADLRDETALEGAVADASAVFHLAGQVAVTTSMVRPLDDFDVNARGTLALLDALRRRNPDAPLIFASTNKVYGDLSDIDLVRDGDRYLPSRADIRAHGVSESRPLCFHTPYGCSKGTADQYVLDYAHSFGLRTAVLRMSCIYGERQFGTEDQGWVAHFLLRAIAGEPVTIYGDGRQVRDVLHVGDAVAAYLAAWQDIDTIAGRAYNLGGGPANAISLLQLIEHMEAMLGTRIDVTFSAWRPGDQRYFVADTQAIRRDLNLAPALGWRAGLRRLAEHFGATLRADAPVQEPAL